MAKVETQEERTIVQILEEAVKKEYESYEYYLNAARHSGRPAVKKMFLKLAEMEKGHMADLNKHLADTKAQIMVESAITGGS
ncbi:MAG: ferritin family protein [Planctomycetota bacterium]|jgi:rubrerythrin